MLDCRWNDAKFNEGNLTSEVLQCQGRGATYPNLNKEARGDHRDVIGSEVLGGKILCSHFTGSIRRDGIEHSRFRNRTCALLCKTWSMRGQGNKQRAREYMWRLLNKYSKNNISKYIWNEITFIYEIFMYIQISLTWLLLVLISIELT